MFVLPLLVLSVIDKLTIKRKRLTRVTHVLWRMWKPKYACSYPLTDWKVMGFEVVWSIQSSAPFFLSLYWVLALKLTHKADIIFCPDYLLTCLPSQTSCRCFIDYDREWNVDRINPWDLGDFLSFSYAFYDAFRCVHLCATNRHEITERS